MRILVVMIAPAEFETAYKTLKGNLGGYIRRFSRNLPIEDLVAETFTEVWANREKYSPERGTLQGFIWSMAKTVVYKHWREEAKQSKILRATPEPDMVQPPASELTDINHAVERLPKELREVVLEFAEGATHREIAEKFGITEETARKRLERARARLRN